MLNVQTLGILLRALRDGNTRPDALRAPGAVAGVARVTPVAADANESLRGDAAVRTLPALRQALPEVRADERDASGSDGTRASVERSIATPRGGLAQAALQTSDPRHAAQAAHASQSNAARTLQPALEGGSAAREAGAPVHATTIANAAAAAYTAHAAADSTALALSATGRWLADVQNRATQPAALQATAPRTHAATTPLVSQSSASTSVLASALERAVVTSGLFYESHLARWVGDELPFATLADEPQAAWTPPVASDSPGAPPALPQDNEQLATLARQLEALETKTLVWSGLVWPGQPASIEIREDEHGSARDAPSDERPRTTWRTRIAMTLPSLGTVEATLALNGETVELALVAARGAQVRLDDARNDLAAALAARALELAVFSIADDDER